jgi:hypothetical protein
VVVVVVVVVSVVVVDVGLPGPAGGLGSTTSGRPSHPNPAPHATTTPKSIFILGNSIVRNNSVPVIDDRVIRDARVVFIRACEHRRRRFSAPVGAEVMEIVRS